VSTIGQNELQEIDAEIVETERLIHERVNEIVSALKKGVEVWEDEKRIAEMRFVLQELRRRRRRLAQGLFLGSASKTAGQASSASPESSELPRKASAGA
jgi:hypothetical protein